MPRQVCDNCEFAAQLRERRAALNDWRRLIRNAIKEAGSSDPQAQERVAAAKEDLQKLGLTTLEAANAQMSFESRVTDKATTFSREFRDLPWCHGPGPDGECPTEQPQRELFEHWTGDPWPVEDGGNQGQ